MALPWAVSELPLSGRQNWQVKQGMGLRGKTGLENTSKRRSHSSVVGAQTPQPTFLFMKTSTALHPSGISTETGCVGGLF
jgi:hypothetical protein